MNKTRLRYRRPVISGTILLCPGGLGMVRRHFAPGNASALSIVKIDLSNAPAGAPRVIRTDDATLARAIADGKVEVVAVPPAIRTPPRRVRRAGTRPGGAPRPIGAIPSRVAPIGPTAPEFRRKVIDERRLLRIDAALRRARRHVGARGVHDQSSARLAMAELRAAGVLFTGGEFAAAERAASVGRRGRRG